MSVAQDAAPQRQNEREEERGEVDRVEPVYFAWIGFGVLVRDFWYRDMD